ncbi:cupin domain-containing protein [bacterium]|nr:cupin domain-containing protein [bacterium]
MPFIKLDQIPEVEPAKGYHATFVHSKNMTIAYWRVDAGSALPDHSHPHEQMCTVIDGTFELTVDGETQKMERGQMAIIPGGIAHSGKALTECFLIDNFYPVREDYRSG